FANIAVYDSNLIAVSPTVQPINCGTHGNISVNATGGVLPYTYLWNTGETTASLQNVSLGNYTVTVSDAGTCVLVTPINAQFYFYTFLTDVLPNCSANGSLTADVYGGTPPFTYIWTTGGTDASITNLAPGYYGVTVTDSTGCSTYGAEFLPTTCNNIIVGTIFNDINANCIQDSGEVSMPNISVAATGTAGTYYGYSDANGNYSIAIPQSGNFTLSAAAYNLICGSLNSCTATSNVFFGSVGDTSYQNNFGYQSGGASFDLLMHPGWHTANPGFDKEYWILYYNDAPIAFTDTATVVFHYDPNLVYFDSIAPLPIHDVVAHTLTWQVYPVPNPGWNWNDRLHAFFHVPSSLPVGYLLQSDFDISPLSGDCNTSNNHLHYSESMTGSLDPNEKEVSPSGNITGADSVLTYTIHFQNTGTDTTHFVIVKDSLSQYLDPTTVQNLASSDPYSEFNISGTGVLTWVFNPLFLPDSSTNEPASKAFVSFSVKTKNNLSIGTQIENTASIYFDYNSAVQTNTVSNSIINGVNNISDKNISVTVYPNPFSSTTSIVVNGVNGKYDFTLNNVLGMKMKEIKNVNTSQFILKRNDLPAGIYFYSISTDGKNVANGKIVIE
ncbi:MAG: T9SS type A sorting domain-containing protein, partial [Bacteroidota bacterium]